jgi:hypothetical protein
MIQGVKYIAMLLAILVIYIAMLLKELDVLCPDTFARVQNSAKDTLLLNITSGGLL